METSVVREVELAAPLEEVWRQLVDPGRLRAWLAPDATVEARPGGRVACRWADGVERVGTVETVAPPHRLRLRWGPPAGASDEGGRPLATTVEFELEPVRAGTRLRVTERGIAPGPWVRLCVSLGWGARMGELGRVGTPPAVPVGRAEPVR